MRTLKKPQIIVALIFLALGAIWILVTDKLSFTHFGHSTPLKLTSIQTIKGVVFVTLSALLIYMLLRKSNRKLRQLSKEYEQLFLKNPNPMWIYDLETLAFLKVNDAAIANYGYTEKEFLNMTIKDIRPEEDWEKLTTRINNLPENISEGALWKHKRKNGELLTVNIVTHSINYYKRKCKLVVSYDLTNVERLEQELLKSNTEISILVNSVIDGFYIINREFTILKHNKQIELTAEVTGGKVPGKNLFEIFPSLENKFLHQQYIKAFETKEAVHFETFYEKTKSWMRVSAYPFENLLSVFIRDVTKEKEGELRIFQSYQDLYALINNTKDLIWSIDRNFRFHIFNKSYKERYTKYIREDLWPGKEVLRKDAPNASYHKWKDLYARALNREKFSEEMKFVLPGHPVSYGLIHFNPIYDTENNVAGVGCFLRDITSTKIYTQKIEIQNRKLKSVAHTVAHIMRPPLANLSGFTKLLDTDLAEKDKIEILGHIKAAAIELDRIITDMVMQTAGISDNELPD